MDKLVVHLDLLYLRLEMTVASFVIVQALSMCCRIQFCMIHGGVPAIFSVLESSEVKFPALEGFVLPTYFPSRLGNLTRIYPHQQFIFSLCFFIPYALTYTFHTEVTGRNTDEIMNEI